MDNSKEQTDGLERLKFEVAQEMGLPERTKDSVKTKNNEKDIK